MRRGHWIALAGLAAVAVVGAIVATSSAGGGDRGPYRFYSGVHVIDQSTIARVYIENIGDVQTSAKVIFTVAGVKDVNTVPIAAGSQASALGANCAAAACETQVLIRSRSPLIAPSLRYGDTDGVLQEVAAGSFVVTRDGKRVF